MEVDDRRTYQRHYEDKVEILASARELFSFIDDHTKLSSHMNKSSLMMGGGSMKTMIDEGNGQKVGSHIRMSGNVLGIEIFLDEVITHREPPFLKIWETVGVPKLIIIGHYRMTAKIEEKEKKSILSVSIDYNLPTKNVWLGKLFGNYYAKWCVKQMIKTPQDNFNKNNRL